MLQGFYVGITILQLELMRIHLIIVFLDFQAILLHFIALYAAYNKS